ncbi:MAG: flippase-like domain-containing protein [bacterium]|nr:flippase-like domain-containing protein [bacterium]MCP4965352.1 flippase-like domain-containing protein [bacterium]
MNDESRSGAPETSAPSKRKQIVAGAVTVITLVIVFAVVLPQLADYGEAWEAIQNMEAPALVLLAVATIANIVVYVWPYQAALPGIKFWPAFVVRQTSFAISNGVPAGGAFGLAVQFKMLGQYGFGAGPATAGIGATSLWNTLVTLALPVLGAIALIVTGDVQGWVISAAAVGLIILAILVVLLVVVFRSESGAERLGRFVDRMVQGAARLVRREVDIDLTPKLLDFRLSTVDLVRTRLVVLTLANVVQQIMQFAVLFIALRGIEAGSDVKTTLIQAFVAFSVGRLGSFIPVTPGGLGTVDAAITGILVGFGTPESAALAATLVWRVATFFPQIFIGIGTYLYWRRRSVTHTGS